MSQIVFTMTSRMVAIAATCLVLLFILLFLLGVQIGKLLDSPVVLLSGTPTPAVSTGTAMAVPGVAPASSTSVSSTP